jgi:hypothetical protein
VAEAGVGVGVGVAAPAALNRAARLTARAASTVPWPVPGPAALSAAAVPPGVTVLVVRARVTWATVRCGNLESRRAATPATMPLAALVLLTRV